MNEMPISIEFLLRNDLFDNKTDAIDGYEDIDLNIGNNRLICLLNVKNDCNFLSESDYIIGGIVCERNDNKIINSTFKPLFVCIKLLKDNPQTNPWTAGTTDSLELIVSQQFLTHYNLSVKDRHLFLRFIPKCPKLTKITIGVKDNELYERIRSQQWSQSLRSLVSNSKSKLLCRKLDIFCANNHLIVLNCEPVLQGIISLDTQIVLINISKINFKNDNSVTEQKLDVFDNGMVKALNLMNFTSRILLNPTIGSSFDGNNKTIIQTLTASTTFLNSMPFSFQITILSNDPSIPDVDSENGCVFVSTNVMMNILQIEPKDWVRITLSSNDKSLQSKQRFAQIYAIDSISDDNMVYISPQMWFNLQNIPHDRHENQPLLQPNITLTIRKDVFREQLKYTSAVHLNLIQSPEYSANTDYSLLLKKYFTKRRYIKKSDVIGISTLEDPLYHTKTKDLTENEWPVVYFRISLIEGNGCLIDTNHSNLYQSGTIRSLIPATLPSYYNRNIITPIYESPSPPGLGSYINTLCDIVMPYLMPKPNTIGTVMLKGPAGCGKKTIVRAVCKHWNLHYYHINTNDLLGETSTQTETKIKLNLSKATVFAPTIVLISNINIVSNNELYDESRLTKAFSQSLFQLIADNNEWPVIVMTTNSEPKKFANNELNSLFTHSLEIDCPNVEEREDIMKALIGDIPTNGLNFKDLSQKTFGFYFGDLKTLVSNAMKYLFEYFDDPNDSSAKTCAALSGVVLTNDYLVKALNDLQKLHSSAIGAPNIPDIKWDDIGGHETIKSEILDTIQLPLECPQLISLGFKRSGVLLHGPPGTGKTLLAKAAANECSLNFLSVKGPELINMFVGQSEENVRNLFSRARKCAPSVIFFDELDSLAPNRGRSGDSGGVMDRVVSQLLAEMDGINTSNDVFVIGATNRPDLLDSALLRPGRFDRLLYVGIAEDKDSRLKILKALTRKFQFDGDIDLEFIESSCPPGLSGADFYSICSNALMNSIQRNIQRIEDNQSVEENNCEIVLQLSDFMAVLPKKFESPVKQMND